MSKTVRLAKTVVDRIPAALCAENMDATQLADLLVTSFNHLHPIDAFYPGQEPLPGTYEGRFCGQPLVDIEASEHARQCAKNAMLSTISNDLSLLHAPDRCTWFNHQDEQCGGRDFEDLKDWSRHVEQHVVYIRNTHGATLCRLLPCKNVLLADTESLIDHLIATHGLPLLSSKGNVANRLAEYCGTWISQLTTPLNEHALTHVGVRSTVRSSNKPFFQLLIDTNLWNCLTSRCEKLHLFNAFTITLQWKHHRLSFFIQI